MMKVYTITRLTPVLNKGVELPGKFRIYATPEEGVGGEIEVYQTREFIGKFDTGTNLIPEPGDKFLGETVMGYIYIIKYIDMITPDRLEQAEYVPKYYKAGQNVSSGDYTIKGQAFNFISLLRNGVIRLFSGPSAYIDMEPYITLPHVKPEVEKKNVYFKDRLSIKFKNFMMKLFGGMLRWSVFEEDSIWKSELFLKVHRGDPLSEEQLENNRVTVQAGSLTDAKNDILKLKINFTTEEGTLDTHELIIGKDGVRINSNYQDLHISSLLIDKEKIKYDSDFNKKHQHTLLINETTLENINVINEKTNKITITENGAVVDIDKDVTLTCTNAIVNSKSSVINGDTIEINGGVTTITGGTLKTKGKSNTDMQGPYNAIALCPYTGAPHSGGIVSGT